MEFGLGASGYQTGQRVATGAVTTKAAIPAAPGLFGEPPIDPSERRRGNSAITSAPLSNTGVSR